MGNEKRQIPKTPKYEAIKNTAGPRNTLSAFKQFFSNKITQFSNKVQYKVDGKRLLWARTQRFIQSKLGVTEDKLRENFPDVYQWEASNPKKAKAIEQCQDKQYNIIDGYNNSQNKGTDRNSINIIQLIILYILTNGNKQQAVEGYNQTVTQNNKINNNVNLAPIWNQLKQITEQINNNNFKIAKYLDNQKLVDAMKKSTPNKQLNMINPVEPESLKAVATSNQQHNPVSLPNNQNNQNQKSTGTDPNNNTTNAETPNKQNINNQNIIDTTPDLNPAVQTPKMLSQQPNPVSLPNNQNNQNLESTGTNPANAETPNNKNKKPGEQNIIPANTTPDLNPAVQTPEMIKNQKSTGTDPNNNTPNGTAVNPRSNKGNQQRTIAFLRTTIPLNKKPAGKPSINNINKSIGGGATNPQATKAVKPITNQMGNTKPQNKHRKVV